MTLERAHELLDQFYEKAKNSNGLIKNPVAWALYQAWRRADDNSWKEGDEK